LAPAKKPESAQVNGVVPQCGFPPKLSGTQIVVVNVEAFLQRPGHRKFPEVVGKLQAQLIAASALAMLLHGGGADRPVPLAPKVMPSY
jgi:hypothetical protein